MASGSLLGITADACCVPSLRPSVFVEAPQLCVLVLPQPVRNTGTRETADETRSQAEICAARNQTERQSHVHRFNKHWSLIMIVEEGGGELGGRAGGGGGREGRWKGVHVALLNAWRITYSQCDEYYWALSSLENVATGVHSDNNHKRPIVRLNIYICRRISLLSSGET